MSEPARNTLAAGAAVERWTPPSVFGPTARPRDRVAYGDLTRDEKATVEEHYARARAEGIAQGSAEFEQQIAEANARLAELNDRIARLDAIVGTLSRPLSELDEQVEQQLCTLALTLAKHLVRRELRIDPAQVIAIIRETVALLPAATRDVRVHLHPEDAAVVREKLAEPQAERAWTIVEDPVMGRGGCRVTTEHSLIDARLETRLAAVVTQVLGSDRSEPRKANE